MASRDRWQLVAVAVLLVLAGCSAFSPAAEPQVTETVTPAPVPTVAGGETPTAATTLTDRPGLAPFTGISARRGVDVERVLDAHVRYLSARSYTVDWTRRTVGGSGPVAREFQRQVQVADNETYLRREAGGRSAAVTTTYVGPDGAYRQTVDGENESVAPVTVRDGGPARVRFARLVAFEMSGFFDAGYNDLDVVQRDGRTYARVFTTRSPPQLGEIYDAYTLRNFSATAWVAPEGYVQAVHYEFDLVGYEDSLAVEWRYAYTDVNATTVERPPWVPASTSTPISTSSTVTTTPTPSPTADPARLPPPTATNETAAD